MKIRPRSAYFKGAHYRGAFRAGLRGAATDGGRNACGFSCEHQLAFVEQRKFYLLAEGRNVSFRKQ